MSATPTGKSCAVQASGDTSASSNAAQKEFVPDEQQLEQLIEAAKQRMCEAPERAGKLRHWREMVRLMDQRSPHYVRFLERMRGLA